MTNEEKEQAQKLLTALNENILTMKKDTEKAELLADKISKAIAKIKPVEKPQRNRRK